jgi:hypothetical protein
MNQQAMGTAEDQARRNDFGVPWGTFVLPNPHLMMTADEQFVKNMKNGFLPAPPTRLQQLDNRIADCHTRSKAAIMRAAAATREV